MPLHLVLVEPEIHWNTGNAGRTALAAGARLHLVAPLGFSLDDKQVRRAGLDYWDRVRPTVWPDFAAFARAMIAPAPEAAFCFSARAGRDYWDARFPDDAVLVFGRESVGLPRDVVASFGDRALRIPMLDEHLRSLNLSTSVALAAYEFLRQRRRA